MSVVVARKFGDRIVSLSDTMISTHAGLSPNVIPGALKSVVISLDTTISYAGNLTVALDVIRATRPEFILNHDLDRLLTELRAATIDGKCDFIVSSHVRGPELRRIWAGRISDALDGCWIGDSDIAGRILKVDDARPIAGNLPEYISHEETQFRRSFRELFTSHGVKVGNGVGGFGVDQLGSPYGHCYNTHGLTKAWDCIRAGIGITDEHERARRSGETLFSYNVQSTRYRGVPVLGAYLEQASLGFIYAPLEADEGIRVSGDHAGWVL